MSLARVCVRAIACWLYTRWSVITMVSTRRRCRFSGTCRRLAGVRWKWSPCCIRCRPSSWASVASDTTRWCCRWATVAVVVTSTTTKPTTTPRTRTTTRTMTRTCRCWASTAWPVKWWSRPSSVQSVGWSWVGGPGESWGWRPGWRPGREWRPSTGTLRRRSECIPRGIGPFRLPGCQIGAVDGVAYAGVWQWVRVCRPFPVCWRSRPRTVGRPP